jgi:hypothetical protein
MRIGDVQLPVVLAAGSFALFLNYL